MADQWLTTAQIGVPQPIQDLALSLDSILDALLTILNIAVAILEVVKTFMVGLLDPISAIINAIISEIEGLIQDIRQIGIYLSGDFEVDYPYDTLLGGYTAYERRMIARLVDRLDPTRPNFTSQSEVVAIFLYASVDVTEIQAAIALIDRIKAFFGIAKKPRTFTQPVGLEVVYGIEGSGFGFGALADVLSGGNAPTRANVRWSMAPPSNAQVVAWPLPSPPGFLVEVSVLRDGLAVAWEAPAPAAGPDPNNQQDRQFGLVSDFEKRPFKLYGGVDMLDTVDLAWEGSGTYDPNALTVGKLKPGAIRLMAYRDSFGNVPIPVNALKTLSGKYLLQRTFFVDIKTFLGVNVLGPGQPFVHALKYEDMPYDADFEDVGGGKVKVTPADEPARSVFVRVSAVTSKFTGVDIPYWKIGSDNVVAGVASPPVTLTYSLGFSGADKSEPSAPLTVTFPSVNTQAYLDAVTAALALMVLSRSDLIPNTTAGGFQADVGFQIDVGGTATGLEDIARYLTGQALGTNNVAKFFNKPNVGVADFRGRLLRRCRALASTLLSRTGPLPTAVESLVVENSSVNGTRLADFPISTLAPDLGLSLSLLDSLNTDTAAGRNTAAGIALNPLSVDTRTVAWVQRLLGRADDTNGVAGIALERHPGFLQKLGSPGVWGDGSADGSPVFYGGVGTSTKMVFIRNALLNYQDGALLKAAALVLNVAAAPMAYARRPGEGAWTAYRLFPQGLPPIEAMLNEIINFLEGLKAGISSIVELIVQYINFVEARILELEALIRRIEALLNVMLAIEVPSASALLVTGLGTDSILQGLVTATNKPSDNSTAYGMGAVILTGGLPAAALDLFELLLVAG